MHIYKLRNKLPLFNRPLSLTYFKKYEFNTMCTLRIVLQRNIYLVLLPEFIFGHKFYPGNETNIYLISKLINIVCHYSPLPTISKAFIKFR